MSIGKLTRLPLREVWKHEALDFTVWLQDNLDLLNEVLDFNLVSAEREQPAGSFSVDLVGEDEASRLVIIENQLERSDHSHLGQVLTYLAQLDAQVAIWIVKEARPEHLKAVNWLIENTDTHFYIIQLEAVKIGDSAPAPLFTKLVGPSLEARAAGVVKKELSGRYLLRKRFWERLLEIAKSKTTLTSKVSATTDNWIGVGAGKSGLTYNFVVTQNECRVEMYFNTGSAESNSGYYDQFAAHKDTIEERFGSALSWEPLEGKQTCRICYRMEEGGYKHEETWDAVCNLAVDKMMLLESSLASYVKKLK